MDLRLSEMLDVRTLALARPYLVRLQRFGQGTSDGTFLNMRLGSRSRGRGRRYPGASNGADVGFHLRNSNDGIEWCPWRGTKETIYIGGC